MAVGPSPASWAEDRTERSAVSEYPPLPETEEEWKAHVAFYRLTVMQRDAAWRENERLRDLLAASRAKMIMTMGGDSRG